MDRPSSYTISRFGSIPIPSLQVKGTIAFVALPIQINQKTYQLIAKEQQTTIVVAQKFMRRT